jgi:H+/Cl- antiporter ClcA
VAATFLSGIAIGLSAATLQAGVSLACRYRNHLLASLFQGSGTPGGGTAVRYVADSLQGLPLVFLCMLGISVTAVWLVTLVVFYHSPKASGGGVASVMALLNGNAIDGLLSGRVYVTKLLGTATSRMAGLALGVEGAGDCWWRSLWENQLPLPAQHTHTHTHLNPCTALSPCLLL